MSTAVNGAPSASGDADISVLVADVKYGEAVGVKICEVQHASLCVFYGLDAVHGGKGLVAENLVDVIASYHSAVFFQEQGHNYPESKKRFLASGWTGILRLEELRKHRATGAVDDRTAIGNYRSVLYTKASSISNLRAFEQRYPGVLLVDEATWPYWRDKYEMDCLFSGDERLEGVRPRWGAYPKKHSPELVEEILTAVDSEMLVIKPRSAVEGRGVMILRSEELGEALESIVLAKKKSFERRDDALAWWSRDSSETLLVEQFVPSDPVHDEEGHAYNATMRVVFSLIQDQGEIRLEFLGKYWVLPARPLNGGSLVQQHKASVRDVRFLPVSPEVDEDVETRLSAPLMLMYRRMLDGRP